MKGQLKQNYYQCIHGARAIAVRIQVSAHGHTAEWSQNGSAKF